MNEKRILIVDDEPTIRSVLRMSLEGEHYTISERATAQSGIEGAEVFHPHLIILDLGLPDMSGLEALKKIRKWTLVPIIILTVSDDEKTKVALLDGGANDYLTKPFGTQELLARVRVALRNHNSVEATPVFESEGLLVDVNQRLVKKDGKVIKLTVTEFELLSVLIRNSGKVVPQAQLLKEIWGKTASDQTHYLRVYIGQLRKKIEKDLSTPKHILTEPGVGYRIV